MAHYRIARWADFQHYKDRNPPWIKLHRELLSSRTWVVLNDSERVLAVACMLLAAATENRIPDDPEYVQRVAYLTKLPDFAPLVKVGFLEFQQDAGELVNNASKAEQALADARPETEKRQRREETEENPDFAVFWESFPPQRKGSKDNALKAWKRATQRARKDEILNGLEAYRRSSEVSGGFAKGAAAWLNDDRWRSQYRPPGAPAPKRLDQPKSNVLTV